MKKLLLFAPALLLLSCGGNSEEKDYEETEYDIKIGEFLEDKSWKPERTESGLYIYKENEGSDEKPNLDSYLTLIYEGRLLDGTVFDGTNGAPVTFPFPVSGLIEGWQEGIPMFGKGGKGKLVIPPDLGYGDRDMGVIAPNSILVFDIEIVDFRQTPPPPPDYTPEILSYMLDQKLDTAKAIKTESGMFIIPDSFGGEEKPTIEHYLTLNYEGYLLDGTSFDGTGGTPTTFPFPLANTIGGWQEGIPYFGKGGKGKLIIPPYIGYGEMGSQDGSIPPNAILVFDIEIIDFTSTPNAQ
ncbi:MAG: FKBP-type peptidyl-prolyl cis-trans isomerase [Crocinitomicaceae bacterium]|nr:FKBP-type peptidyl-prolyl cis-trans isomerase [Crocinitomicaceae bacterium]